MWRTNAAQKTFARAPLALRPFPTVVVETTLHRMSALPLAEYRKRLQAREAKIAQTERAHARVANFRLLVFLALLTTAWLSLKETLLSAWWLPPLAAVFIAMVIRHGGLRRGLAAARRGAAVYSDGIARMEDRWRGRGEPGERFNDPHHVYAADLDLFGQGGLFQLLSTARTRMGEDTLTRWLLSPAMPEEIRERQPAVTELRDRLDLREDLATLSEKEVAGIRPTALLAWAEAPNELTWPVLRWIAAGLMTSAIASAVVWQVWGPLWPLLVVLMIEVGIVYALRKELETAVLDVERAFEDLDTLSALLGRLEREPFQSAMLRAAQSKFTSTRRPGSQVIASLRRIVLFVEARRNSLFHLLDVPLLYSLQFALAAERWRSAHGKSVRGWLEALGDIEALLAIATYSYEHPDDVFPEWNDGPPAFDASQLGHPLLPTANCVRNDVALTGGTRVLLVSGSNMSGKSTLLRTVGINVVLAMAGAPVRARRMQLTPLQVGASIRINDSLHEGSSRFYAEITRLRRLYDLTAGSLSLLFLLDELLQGTNSADRRVGAEGVIRAFIERNAIGLVSTHDLALSHIEGLPEGALHNVHFQDEIENGRMKFDFKLRDGVVTKSNGLELMRSIGLKV